MDQKQLSAANSSASTNNSLINMHHYHQISQSFSSPQSLFSSNNNIMQQLQQQNQSLFCNSISTATANSSHFSSLNNSLYNSNSLISSNQNNYSSTAASCTTVSNIMSMTMQQSNDIANAGSAQVCGHVSLAADVDDELSTVDWNNPAQFGELLAIDELLDFPTDDGTTAATGGSDGANNVKAATAEVVSGASTANSGVHSPNTVDSNSDGLTQVNSSSDTASSVSDPKAAMADNGNVNPAVLQGNAGSVVQNESTAASKTASSMFEAGGLCVPSDDFAELEWLSHFVEDSMSSGVDMSCSNYNMFLQSYDNSRRAPSGNQNRTTTWTAGNMIGVGCLPSNVSGKTLVKLNSSAASPDSVLENTTVATAGKGSGSGFSSPRNYSSVTGIMSNGCRADVDDDDDGDGYGLQYNSAGVQKAARSKRSRNGACFWNSRILSTVEAYVVNNSGSPAAPPMISPGFTPASAASSGLLYKYRDYDIEECEMGYGVRLAAAPPARKKTKVAAVPTGAPAKKAAGAASGGSVASDSSDGQGTGRKCLHCGAQKTPQWRAGPMGPKTLCNACGVRFKSGRLLPEYRPAASPTFVEAVHSNSHRRVLEMRRQKGCPEGTAANFAANRPTSHTYFQTSSPSSSAVKLTSDIGATSSAAAAAQLPRPNSNSNLQQFNNSASASFSSAIHAQLGAQLVN